MNYKHIFCIIFLFAGGNTFGRAKTRTRIRLPYLRHRAVIERERTRLLGMIQRGEPMPRNLTPLQASLIIEEVFRRLPF